MALIEKYDASSCDYCGDTPEIAAHQDGTYRVECDCGLCGPWEETERDAILYWGCIKVDTRSIHPIDPFRLAEDRGDKISNTILGGFEND